MGSDSIRKALESIAQNPSQRTLETISKPHSSWTRLPEIKPIEIPTHEEISEYKSAGRLMQSLARSIVQWRKQLPSNQQPAILALLNGGVQIDVEGLAEESFHGIRIIGRMQGNPCMILAHQATVQLLCYIETIEKEEDRKSIGFIFGGKEQEL